MGDAMLGSVDVLNMLRGKKKTENISDGLHVIQATVAEPNPVKFKIVGTEVNLSSGMFDIPVSVYPICKGDQFLAFPIIGNEHRRWGIVAKLTGSGRLGTMLGTNSCRVDGVTVIYNGSKIIPPKGAQSGDRVAIIPYGTPDNVRYILVPIDYRLYTECGYYGRNH